MMASTAIVGLTSGKRLLCSSIYSSDLNEKLLTAVDHVSLPHSSVSSKTVVVAKRTSNFNTSYSSNKGKQAIRAVQEQRDAILAPSNVDSWIKRSSIFEEEDDSDVESSLEALILLQKSMLEKQWNLSFSQAVETFPGGIRRVEITRSGISARKRRNHTRRKCLRKDDDGIPLSNRKHHIVNPELQPKHTKDYIRGSVSKEILSHAEVVRLSKKIKDGLFLEEQRQRLEEKLGSKPSDRELASSLQLSCVELQSKMIECSLARDRLAMCNIRLVHSIALKYCNFGVEMADLIQGGLVGLLRGIEKFDASKGFRFSTYVYWWIRQGVSKTLAYNSRTLRLPSHLHERLYSIRNAKTKLEEQGTFPTLTKIAEVLNMSERKVRNATESVTRVFSLDREVFPSLNGLPGKTFHSYVADTHMENNPWHGFEKCYMKAEVYNLLAMSLGEREQEIIRLYYGLECECHSWEEISMLMGLSRERVRQVGLVAMEKLKHAARRKRLEALLVQQ